MQTVRCLEVEGADRVHLPAGPLSARALVCDNDAGVRVKVTVRSVRTQVYLCVHVVWGMCGCALKVYTSSGLCGYVLCVIMWGCALWMYAVWSVCGAYCASCDCRCTYYGVCVAIVQ